MPWQNVRRGGGCSVALDLAHILEADGDVGAACDMIQDVHVETYGSLSKKEKAQYILEQVRLNLVRKDWIRTIIQSRKMNVKVLEEEGFEDVKITYYKMMIDYQTHEQDAWEICQCYYKIYSTSTTKADPVAKVDALQSCVIYLLLSKFDNHVSDMLHRIKALKDLEESPDFQAALGLFTTQEIIPYPFPQQVAIESHSCIGRGQCGGPEAAAHFKGVLRTRVLQHNLRVVAFYYTRIRSVRLAGMLGLDLAALEMELSGMSQEGDIHVKIDRPAGVVSFVKPVSPEEVLSDWTSGIGKMLTLMDNTCHLINREMMVHKLSV